MQFNEKPNVLDKTINFMELLKCNKFQQDKNPFSNLAFDTLIGTLHSYFAVSVKLSMDGSFSREANGFAFETARYCTVTRLYEC